MRYYAQMDGAQRTVDVESAGEGRYRICIDGGEPRVVDAAHVEGHVVNVLVEHRSWDVDLEEDGEQLNVLVGDELFRLELMDDRKLRLAAARGKFSVDGPVVVEAPMPGKVVKLLVQAGDEVAEGQGLVIVEAMKMENELKSPKAGRVGAVHVAEGNTVEGHAALVSIE